MHYETSCLHKSTIKNRVEIGYFLNDKGLKGTAVEVGVWRGDYAWPFLELWEGRAMILIDPWDKLDDYDDIRNRDFDPRDYYFVQQRFKPLGNRVCLYRSTSLEAVKVISPDESLDFVYIDANHSYTHVTRDLEAWWNKVKPGGYLGGHDMFSLDHPGVTCAVVEFCRKEHVHAEIIPGEKDDYDIPINDDSWLIEKPL
jgi:hypothetical protein